MKKLFNKDLQVENVHFAKCEMRPHNQSNNVEIHSKQAKKPENKFLDIISVKLKSIKNKSLIDIQIYKIVSCIATTYLVADINLILVPLRKTEYKQTLLG